MVIAEGMTILLCGEKQKRAIVAYFLEFILKKESPDYNRYKAESKRIYEHNLVLEKNRKILIVELLKHKTRSDKQRSENRITGIGDDTCDGKKFSKKSRKVHRILDHSLKQKVKTHNIVFLAFTVGMGRNCRKYILDFRVWQKGVKTKHQLFLDMIRNIRSELLLHSCDTNDIVFTFDSGYSYEDVLNELDELKLLFVGKFHHRKEYHIDGKRIILTTWLRNRFRAKNFEKVSKKYMKRIRNQYYKYR